MSDGELLTEPVTRKLRIFAFDPSVSAQFNTAGIGEITIPIRWESDLQPGWPAPRRLAVSVYSTSSPRSASDTVMMRLRARFIL